MKRLTALFVAFAMFISGPIGSFANIIADDDFQTQGRPNQLMLEEDLAPAADDNDVIHLPDANMIRGVAEIYGIPVTPELQRNTDFYTKRQMRRILMISPEICTNHDLAEFGKKVYDLTGIEHMENVKFVSMSRYCITDLTPLSGLRNLKHLDLMANKTNLASGRDALIQTAEPLKDVVSLEYLNIRDSAVGDTVVHLKNLVKMKHLDLRNCKITDASFLENMNDIQYLDLENNRIFDISSLENKTKLTTLKIDGFPRVIGNDEKRISDISPLSESTNLRSLSIAHNDITNIDVVKNMRKLEEFYATGNKIADFSPLLGLPNLRTVWVGESANGPEGSEINYPIANRLFFEINKEILTKEDLPKLREIMNSPEAVTKFFGNERMQKIGNMITQLEANENVTNSIYQKEEKPLTYDVIYKFTTVGRYALPDRVLSQLPGIEVGFVNGTEVTPTMPKLQSLQAENNKAWVFNGYDKERAVIDGDNIVFMGYWQLKEVSKETDPENLADTLKSLINEANTLSKDASIDIYTRMDLMALAAEAEELLSGDPSDEELQQKIEALKALVDSVKGTEPEETEPEEEPADVNKAKLQEAVAKAEAVMKTEDYANAEMNAMMNLVFAKAKAQDILSKTEATEEEVEKALVALEAAIEAIQGEATEPEETEPEVTEPEETEPEETEPEEIDLTRLQDAIAKANEFMRSEEYKKAPNDLKFDFIKAKTEAAVLEEKGTATEEEINQAIEKLEATIEAIQGEETEPEETEPEDTEPGTTKPVKPVKPIETPETEETAQSSVIRISGNNRYETAVEVSKKYHQSSELVVLASGEVYPDALVATALASEKSAPILLTRQNVVDDQTIQEIIRLNANRVIIVGGENTISNEVVEQLHEMGLSTNRIFGQNRYETAEKIFEEIHKSNPVKGVIIASGENYADALVASGLSVKKGLPILLTPVSEMKESTKEIVGQLSDSIIVGGKASVSKKIEDDLEGNVLRLAGENRYETSLVIAQYAFKDIDSVIVASGENYADALIASVAADKEDAPILLVRKDSIHEEVENYIEKANALIAIGGHNSISDEVIK